MSRRSARRPIEGPPYFSDKFTPGEAKAQDAENRERLEKGRTGRFEPFLSGEEQQARALRGSKV